MLEENGMRAIFHVGRPDPENGQDVAVWGGCLVRLADQTGFKDQLLEGGKC